MMRIVALNEDTNSEDNDDDEIQVTKEAEETIAIAEYMRALHLKQKGHNDIGLSLFLELLETQVISEVQKNNKDDKLFSVRYNCFRNIGLIYEQSNDQKKALEYLLDAIELDDTDVYTMNKVGHLALKMNKIEIAQDAFLKCLNRNPNHWPAADGLLQVYCLSENVKEAYGWALHLLKKNQNYKRGIVVLDEISGRFSSVLPFLQKMWIGSYKPHGTYDEKNHSCFVSPIDNEEENNQIDDPDYDSFKTNELSWISIGTLIIETYNYLTENNLSMLRVFHIKPKEVNLERSDQENVPVADAVLVPDIEMSDQNEEEVALPNENADMEFPALQNNDFIPPSPYKPLFDKPDMGDDNEYETNKSSGDAKPKSRRRGSDLSFLEQWGWHKNRRSSKKKTSHDDPELIDTTINGFLKRIFAPFFIDHFDTNQSPFIEDCAEKEHRQITQRRTDTSQNSQITERAFQIKTAVQFEKFIASLDHGFDMITILLRFLEAVSKFWQQPIPIEIQELYLEIHNLYDFHNDFNVWNLFSPEELSAHYGMNLFYLELKFEKISVCGKEKIDQLFKSKINFLTFMSGQICMLDEVDYLIFASRLSWIHYYSAMQDNNLENALDSIYKLIEIIESNDDKFILEFPNQTANSSFHLAMLNSVKNDLLRQISLNNIRKLYDQKKYKDLVRILKENLVNSTEVKNYDNSTMKIETQFEVLLECLWHLEQIDECLVWCEKCLKYLIDIFLASQNQPYRQREWGASINFVITYIESLINQEGVEILYTLEKYLGRLVQSITKILKHQLDTPVDKNNTQLHPINTKIPWIILFHLLQREEDMRYKSRKVQKPKLASESSDGDDVEENLPHSIQIFFTAHDFLGRRCWCTKDGGQLLLFALDVVSPKMRSPMMEPFREMLSEYIEQVTYCLYGYPPKKARSRHIEEHESTQIELNWERAIQLFDIYKPDNLPEFNSYKLESISAEMEQFLQKILHLMPAQMDLSQYSQNVKDYIKGSVSELANQCYEFPSTMYSIYYLLADYYFKNRDFLKTMRFFVLDLTLNPTRLDSWAGLALSKATKLEAKINSCRVISTKEFLIQSDEVLRCFEQCTKINPKLPLIWIEFGQFAYMLHSFCSRNLKQTSDTLSMEQFESVEKRKEDCLRSSEKCFVTAQSIYSGTPSSTEVGENGEETDIFDDEKWLHHFMLGKIAEKQKDQPMACLLHYVQAGKCLYECNATYPIKISHCNPQNLSIEALEVFYRITATIVKYLEQHRTITREMGKNFSKILKEMAASPFAFNKAKIDDNSINALKRKLPCPNEIVEPTVTAERTAKQPKMEEPTIISAENKPIVEIIKAEIVDEPRPATPKIFAVPVDEKIVELKSTSSTTRRGSQESSATTTTATSTATSSSTSSSSSSESSDSDSSSSDSESASTSDEDGKLSKTMPISETDLNNIYKVCIKNLEECVTRFPEHYKSIFRLCHHYINTSPKFRDLEKCRQLLLGTYTTALGNKIQGLFADRKNNNFFYGIWRIPSSEIDRPGSFASHLSRCVAILMDVLKNLGDHRTLFDLAIHLQRTPDPDKMYIKEVERKELFQQAVSFCIQTFKNLLKTHSQVERNNSELLSIMIEIYKTHRKCTKHLPSKENSFAILMVDACKVYLQLDESQKPLDHAVLMSMAGKLCMQEILARKNNERSTVIEPREPVADHFMKAAQDISIPVSVVAVPTQPPPLPPPAPKKNPPIPGISRPRGRPVGSKNTTTTTSTAPSIAPATVTNPLLNVAQLLQYAPNMMGLGQSTLQGIQDPALYAQMLTEYFKMAFNPAKTAFPGQRTAAPETFINSIPPRNTSVSVNRAVSSYDTKNLIASTATLTASSGKPSSTINLGNNQLTILPTSTPPMPLSDHGSKVNYPTDMSDHRLTNKKDMNKIPPRKLPEMNLTNIPAKIIQEIKRSSTPKEINPATIMIPTDLPKSLTITATPYSYSSDKIEMSSKQVPLQSSTIVPNYPKKPKPKTNKNQTNAQTPFMPLDRAALNHFGKMGTSIAPQFPPNLLNALNNPEYNRQLSLLSSLSETFNAQMMSQISSAHPYGGEKRYQQPKKPSAKRAATKSHAQTATHSMPTSVLKSNQAKIKEPPPRYAQVPLPVAHSPTKSPILTSNFPMQTMTPPPVYSTQISPTKTLQQKLAERQKACASLSETSNSNIAAVASTRGKNTSTTCRDDDDVIILE